MLSIRIQNIIMAVEYSSSVCLILLLIFFNRTYSANAAKNDGLGASFIFGDSLVDAGNNNYLSTLSKANIPPNGIDFKASGGNPTGRYTNGRTIGDIVGIYICSRKIFIMLLIIISFVLLRN